MSTSRRLRRTAALSVVSALALGASAEAASAAPFDLLTNPTISSGQARSWGSVALPTATTLKVVGKIDDRCSAANKGDGYGAYVEFQAVHTDGTRAPVLRKSDERGCKAKKARSIRLHKTYRKQIARVEIRVYERNGAGQVADTQSAVVYR